MTPDQLDELLNDEVMRKRLAKWMARFCVRENTKLESFHDRISDDEMKELMIDVVNQCYLFLSILTHAEATSSLIELMKLKDPLPEWEEPQLPWKLLRSAEELRKTMEGQWRGEAA